MMPYGREQVRLYCGYLRKIGYNGGTQPYFMFYKRAMQHLKGN